jgi:hypothetical protein
VSSSAAESTYKVSGYILDSNGKGVSNANVVFNVPTIVSSVFSNQSGYYEIHPPVGTYHINVWPPFDGNYISYDEPSFNVNSDISKNITLNSGYKISGFLSDSSGAPVVGAVVFFNNYGSGWFSTSTGYYFLSAPAGTYTIDAHPRVGTYSGTTTSFQTYYEYNFVVNGNTQKNITVNTQTATPTPSPPSGTSAPTIQPTPVPSARPTPVPTPTLPSTHITLSTDATSSQVGSTLNIQGKLADRSGNALQNKTVILSYTISDSTNWVQIGSGVTDLLGGYSIQWVTGASGSFNLKVQWDGDSAYQGTYNTTTLNILPYQNKQVFFVESNSTITSLEFNSTSLAFGFSVTGPSGSSGYTKATIAKTLAPNSNGPTVSLDGKEVNCTITSSNDYWIIEFTYHHSTHQVNINLNSNTKENSPTDPTSNTLLWGSVILAIISAVVALALITKKQMQKNS